MTVRSIAFLSEHDYYYLSHLILTSRYQNISLVLFFYNLLSSLTTFVY